MDFPINGGGGWGGGGWGGGGDWGGYGNRRANWGFQGEAVLGETDPSSLDGQNWGENYNNTQDFNYGPNGNGGDYNPPGGDFGQQRWARFKNGTSPCQVNQGPGGSSGGTPFDQSVFQNQLQQQQGGYEFGRHHRGHHWRHGDENNVNPTQQPTQPGGTGTTPDVSVDPLVEQALGLTDLTDPTVQGAVKTLEGVLQTGGKGAGGTGATSTSKMLTDAGDSNDPDDTNAGSSRFNLATQALASTQDAETQALATLSQTDPNKAAEYTTLFNQLGSSGGDNGDPVAQCALREMLITGKLTNGKTDAQGGNLLDTLAGVADGSTPLAAAIDAKRITFARELVKETATASATDQQNTQICGPDVATLYVDDLDPAEYARLATQAASPDGVVTFADGTTTVTRTGDGSDDGTGRSLPVQLLANVTTQVAGTDPVNGTTPEGLQKLASALLGRTMTLEQIPDNASDAQASALQASWMGKIEASGKNGAPVMAAIGLVDPTTGTVSGHEVKVNGVITDKTTGQEYVEYTNPWGDEEVMAKNDFMAVLGGIIYDPNTVGQTGSQLALAQTGNQIARAKGLPIAA
jgi:hypothetical protein